MKDMWKRKENASESTKTRATLWPSTIKSFPVQLPKSHLCGVDTPRSVDGGNIDHCVVRVVTSYFPSRAAVVGVPRNAENAAEIREGRKTAESGIARRDHAPRLSTRRR
jgi:hypothetical protein